MNLLVLDQQIHLFFNSQFAIRKIKKKKINSKNNALFSRILFPPKTIPSEFIFSAKKNSQPRKIMRENKTLTGATGGPRFAPCGPRAPRVRKR
jgi:hypothetical protein